jgi:hypothetical protein
MDRPLYAIFRRFFDNTADFMPLRKCMSKVESPSQ